MHANVNPIFPSTFSFREIPNFVNRKGKPSRNMRLAYSTFTEMKRQRFKCRNAKAVRKEGTRSPRVENHRNVSLVIYKISLHVFANSK